MITLVVLAAGLATRFGAPKQLVAVGPSGETVMDYAVFDAWRAGCRDVVFVVRDELRSSFEREVLPRWRTSLHARLAVQRNDDAPLPWRGARTKPWGTAHALLTAARTTDGDMLVCNADDFYGATAYLALRDALRGEPAEHAVAGYALPATLTPHGGVSRAICRVDASGRLRRIEEHTGIVRNAAGIADDRGVQLDDSALVSMNLWAFHRTLLPLLQREFVSFLDDHGADATAEFRIPDVVNDLVGAGAACVRVIPTAEPWCGLTYAADLAHVRERIAALVRAGAYPANLFATE